MEQLVIRYGLVAILLGAGIEGEPFALAGGILAHRRWLPAWAAALAAVAGSCLVDQGWFQLSRRFRDGRRVRAIARRPAFARCLRLLERHPRAFVLLFRFAYGVRAVAPVAIGLSGVPAKLFVPLNLVAAAVWGCGFTALGYVLGRPFEAAERRYGTAIELAAVALSVLALAVALRSGKEDGEVTAP